MQRSAGKISPDISSGMVVKIFGFDCSFNAIGWLCFALSENRYFFIISGFIREEIGTSNLRIGIGHDTHRLGPGSSLRLGGVDLPHNRSLIGHSDADVLLHALIDALLGAAAIGDIGQLFPNTDVKNADRDSVEMLKEVACEVQQVGYQVVNVDCIVFADRPKIAPFGLEIRRSIATMLSVLPEAVGVKAKTGEGVGPVGREEAISAQVVALLEKKS